MRIIKGRTVILLPTNKDTLKRFKERVDIAYMKYRLLFLREFGFKYLRALDLKYLKESKGDRT